MFLFDDLHILNDYLFDFVVSQKFVPVETSGGAPRSVLFTTVLYYYFFALLALKCIRL